MKKSEIKEAMVSGIILEDMVNNVITRNINMVELGFETLLILSPEVALSVIKSLNENLSEEVVNEQIETVKEYKERLISKIDLDLEDE